VEYLDAHRVEFRQEDLCEYSSTLDGLEGDLWCDRVSMWMGSY